MATVDKNPIKAIYLTFTNEFKTFAKVPLLMPIVNEHAKNLQLSKRWQETVPYAIKKGLQTVASVYFLIEKEI